MTPHPARPLTATRITVTRVTMGRSTGLAATLVAPFVAVAGSLLRELRFRRDMSLLATMADHELADIGLVRSQITDAVRSGRLSPWLDRG
jgi:uncharacterized protein YjiS (DUF1127 family)